MADIPTNPLPCGCAAYGTAEIAGSEFSRTEYRNVHVKHCPLHAAAQELLEAVKAILPDLPTEADILDEAATNEDGRASEFGTAVMRLRRVVRKAAG